VSGVSIWFYNRITRLSTITGEIEDAQMQTFRILKTEHDFLIYDSRNKNFYKNKKSIYLEKHNQLLDSLKKRLYILLELQAVKNINTQKISVTEKIKHIIQEIESYEKTFNQLTEAMKNRGWIDTGKEGELVDTYQKLQDKYENIYPEVKNLYVGEIEKLTIDDCYQLAKRLQSVTEEVQTFPRLLEIEQAEFLKTLMEYQTILNEIIRLEELIGNKHDEGLQKKLKQYAENTTNLMEKLVHSVNKEVMSIEKYLFNLFIGITISMLLIGIFLSYWLANIITKPIQQLSETIHNSVQGQFSGDIILIQNNSKDEVGKLTQNFNVMLKEIHARLAEDRINHAKLAQQNNELNEVNEQLRKSENHLKRLNDVKNTFFSIISHDLRAPLNTLNGFLQILNMQADAFSPEELANFAQSMEKSISRLQDLLENLLQWSLSQTGDIEFNPQRIKLGEIISTNVELYTEVAKNKKIDLIYHIKDEICLHVDKNMTDFILRNLISNAIKFSNPNSTIEVVGMNVGDFAQISVQDHGIGMTKEHLSKIFKPEEHISTPGTQSEKGTGFGLLLCKNFVERNGGYLEVESEVGKGTNIFVFLPTSTLTLEN
jgi:signal transduction histidine kinase